jgi:hypothetical protein
VVRCTPLTRLIGSITNRNQHEGTRAITIRAWALQEAAIKADKLHAEMEAAGKSASVSPSVDRT